MKRLLGYLKEHLCVTILAPLFKMLEASFELFVPLVVASMIDVGIGHHDIGYLWKMGGLLILLGIIGFSFSITAQYFAARSAVYTGKSMRSDLFAHINQFSYQEIDQVGTSTLINRMSNDINQVQNGVNMFLRLFLRSPFVVFGAMFMAFTVDHKAAVSFVFTITALAVVVGLILWITMPMYKKVQKQVDGVLKSTRENLLGIRVIRAFNRQRSEEENFRLQKDVILPCLGLGISTFVMLSTESILSISFTSSLSRYGGDLAVGAMTIITSVSQLATLPLQGICQGGQPIMSYNFGAGNKERVKKAFFTQFKVCTIFTSCFWLIMLLFPKMFAGIFSNNTDLITYTAWALRIYMAGIFSLGFQVACQQSFMALGQAKVSLLLACLRKLILLIPLIFILPLFIQDKVFAVFLAEPISDIVAAAITTITFMSRFNGILNRGKV